MIDVGMSTTASGARLGISTLTELVMPESLKSRAPTRNEPEMILYTSSPLASIRCVSCSTDAPLPRLCTPMSLVFDVSTPPSGSSGLIISMYRSPSSPTLIPGRGGFAGPSIMAGDGKDTTSCSVPLNWRTIGYVGKAVKDVSF